MTFEQEYTEEEVTMLLRGLDLLATEMRQAQYVAVRDGNKPFVKHNAYFLGVLRKLREKLRSEV
jgi:hypothetical protein